MQILDCGNNTQSQETIQNQPNFDCFINASKSCKSAKLLNTITTDFFGILSTVTTHMELKEIEAGKCVYYQKTKSNSVGFSDELVQQMLDNGLTQEEIDQQEQTANETAQKTVGFSHTCKFDNNDLTSMLSRWKEGNVSGGVSCTLKQNGTSDCTYTGDFENAECTSGY